MSEEFESLQQNKTLLVNRPVKGSTVKPKQVNQKKEGIPDVEPARYKDRLVAKGFTQVEGVDYNEMFSPLVKNTSITVLIALFGLVWT